MLHLIISGNTTSVNTLHDTYFWDTTNVDPFTLIGGGSESVLYCIVLFYFL